MKRKKRRKKKSKRLNGILMEVLLGNTTQKLNFEILNHGLYIFR